MDAIAAVVWGTILSVICAPDETIIDKIAPPYWGGAQKSGCGRSRSVPSATAAIS